MSVKIYTANYCGFCRAAKELLQSKGINFEEIDVTDNDKERERLVEITGMRTVPQIFINEKAIGGYDKLKMLADSGDLDRLIKS